jgi:anti-anti-sigma factor
MAETARITALYSGSVSVQLTGELDLVSAPVLTEQFDAALTISPDLVVDLHEVTFLDAAVITTLLRAQQHALAQGGSVVLVGASPWVEKVLRASRVTEAIPLLPNQHVADPTHRRDASLISALRNRRTMC